MKNKVPVLILIILLIAILAVILFFGVNRVHYNNTKSVEELVTKKYSADEIVKLLQDVNNSNMDYYEFSEKYNVECLRKTFQGYYVVFLTDDGKRVFIFTDDEMELRCPLVLDHINNKDVFNFVEVDKTTKAEIQNADSNIFYPYYGIDGSAHIVQEGLFIITYSNIDKKTYEFLKDPIVRTIDYYGDDSSINDKKSVYLLVPYILEIDKNF